MLLSALNVSSGYGGVRIVQDVNLSVKEGEIVAIVGRNGVGKTTLMKTLIGLIGLLGGKIEFKGEDISRFRPSHRADIGFGYVPQGRDIFAYMTVKENLRLGEAVGGKKRASNYDRVYRYFPRLEDRGSQKAGSLSGGEQQQLAIGRVLVGHPELILLDEPSEGVQPNLVQEIARIIRRMQAEEGLTVVIVEQNLALIHAVADRCVVMDKGAVVKELSTEEIADPETAKRYLAV
jgi:branched-chain amino acid transport system ATP-binding protein